MRGESTKRPLRGVLILLLLVSSSFLILGASSIPKAHAITCLGSGIESKVQVGHSTLSTLGQSDKASFIVSSSCPTEAFAVFYTCVTTSAGGCTMGMQDNSSNTFGNTVVGVSTGNYHYLGTSYFYTNGITWGTVPSVIAHDNVTIFTTSTGQNAIASAVFVGLFGINTTRVPDTACGVNGCGNGAATAATSISMSWVNTHHANDMLFAFPSNNQTSGTLSVAGGWSLTDQSTGPGSPIKWSGMLENKTVSSTTSSLSISTSWGAPATAAYVTWAVQLVPLTGTAITVESNPLNLPNSVTVNGTTYPTNPVGLTWAPGSHWGLTGTALITNPYGNGSNYGFGCWGVNASYPGSWGAPCWDPIIQPTRTDVVTAPSFPTTYVAYYFTANLVSNMSTRAIGHGINFTFSTNRIISTAPYYLFLYDLTNNSIPVGGNCGSLTLSCTITITSNHQHTETYVACVSPDEFGGAACRGSVINSSRIMVTWSPTIVTVYKTVACNFFQLQCWAYPMMFMGMYAGLFLAVAAMFKVDEKSFMYLILTGATLCSLIEVIMGIMTIMLPLILIAANLAYSFRLDKVITEARNRSP